MSVWKSLTETRSSSVIYIAFKNKRSLFKKPYSSLMQYILTAVSPFFAPSSPPPSSPKEKEGFWGTSTPQGTRYSKTSHKVLTSRRKRFPKSGKKKKSQKYPIPTTKKSPQNTKLTTIISMQRTHAGSVTDALVSVSPPEPCFIDSIGHAFPVSSTSLAPPIPPL